MVRDLHEPVGLVAMMLVDVVESGHGLGCEVFTASLDVHLHHRQCADVVLLSDEQQHVTAATPSRLHVHRPRHVVVRGRHHPAQHPNALTQRLGDRIIIRRCHTRIPYKHNMLDISAVYKTCSAVNASIYSLHILPSSS